MSLIFQNLKSSYSSFKWLLPLLALLTICIALTPAVAAERIVFYSDMNGNNDIYTMNPDGSDVKQLTTFPGYDGNPRLSPDGRKIVFESGRYAYGGNPQYPQIDIFIMDVDGQNEQCLTSDSATTKLLPDFSPDGSKIVYSSIQPGPMWGGFRITTMDVDGSNKKVWTSDTSLVSMTEDLYPRYSPDGNTIVYHHAFNTPTNEGGYQNLMLLNVADGAITTLTDNSTSLDYDYEPSFSPDGQTIAYIHGDATTGEQVHGQTDIYSIKMDGTEKRRLTATTARSEFDPNFNPTGDKLVYSSYPVNDYSRRPDIFVMDVPPPVSPIVAAQSVGVLSGLSTTTTTPTKLTNNGARNEYPSWEEGIPYPATAPMKLALSNQNLNDTHNSGATVGTLTTFDVNPDDTFTYSLVPGEGDTDNTSFSIDGAFLKTAVTTDPALQSSYAIRVRTTDQTGLFFEQTFTITISDTTKPSVVVGTPFNNQKLLFSGFNPNTFSGTAKDSVGVVSVGIKLFRTRNGVNQVWNGTTFTSTTLPLPATLVGSGANIGWKWDTALPSSSQLDEGAYIIYAYATDAAGNTSNSRSNFTLVAADTEKPTALTSTPTLNQKILISNFTTGVANAVSGTATDNVGVNGIKVKLSRKRGTQNYYWNGTSFTIYPVFLNATLSSVGGSSIKWNLDSQMPPTDQLDSGLYQLEAYAVDVANNKSATIVRPFTLGADFTAPNVVITSPTASQRMSINLFGANTISGTATDNIGVTSVKVKLQRKRGSVIEYWNGTAFTTTTATVDAVVTTVGSTSVTWSLNNVPTPVQGLDSGAYTLYASAYDAVGNQKSSPSRGFTLTGIAGAASAVTTAASASGS